MSSGYRHEVNRIAEFAARQSFDSLPAQVVARAKCVILDTVGVQIRGTTAPSISALRSALVGANSGKSTVLGSKFKANPSLAALLNGSLPTVTQYNEGHRPTMGQPAIHILPAAYAVAEDRASDGRSLITALVVGYEIAARVGLCLFPMNPRIHPQGHFASIGAAVATGKLLGFDVRQFESLLDAIANLCVFSWKQATATGGTIHHLSAGFGASHAVISALAIQGGMVGAPGCFEEFFLPFSSPNPKLEKLTAGLGTEFEILANYYKWYPVCAHIHSCLEALEGILAENAVDPTEIRAIDVRTFPSAFDLVGQSPQNCLAGIFSIPYCLATWVLRREISVEDVATEKEPDPDVLKLAKLINVTVDPELKPAYPEGRPARVTLKMSSGAVHHGFIALPREIASQQDLQGKFLELTSSLLGEGKSRSLLNEIMALENCPDVRIVSRFLD